MSIAATNGVSHEPTHKTVTDWKKFFVGFKMPHPPGKPDKQLPLGHRIAHVLDYVARKAPYNYVPYNVLFREIMGLESTPRVDNENVAIMRRKLSGVRPLLQKVYKRDLKNLSGMGVRATVDDLDVVRTTTVNVVQRVNSAHSALKANVALVSVSKLPEGSDKRWFQSTVSPAVRMLTDDPRMLKLLPPATTTMDKGDKKSNE